VHRKERLHRDDGFLMAALLVAMTVMFIVMAAALPAWQTAARREKEAELIFRGKQYARAISAFSRKYGGAYPPTVDVLINERFLRKKYKDPITGEDFVFVGPGSALPTTSTGPLGVGASTRPGGTGGSSTPQSSASGSLGAASGISQSSRGMSTSTALTSAAGNTQTGRAGTAGSTAGTTAIQAVYSKSKDKSLRVYNGYDHYNEWIFAGTLATQNVGSPTGGRAGTGTRGGAAGTRGGQPTGLGGRGGGAPPAQPFGGQAPGGAPRGVGPGGFGGATGVPGRGR